MTLGALYKFKYMYLKKKYIAIKIMFVMNLADTVSREKQVVKNVSTAKQVVLHVVNCMLCIKKGATYTHKNV